MKKRSSETTTAQYQYITTATVTVGIVLEQYVIKDMINFTEYPVDPMNLCLLLLLHHDRPSYHKSLLIL